ncbi:hypothetical protein AH698_003282 [Salmonella enterica subsp. enterica serovar Poona]|nr:hypothetical protein [Salmonella enterica subsp. enterica serovar Poona]
MHSIKCTCWPQKEICTRSRRMTIYIIELVTGLLVIAGLFILGRGKT